MDVLETNRVILRRFVIEDATAMAEALNDPEIARFLPNLASPAAYIELNLRRYERDGVGKWAMLLKP